MTTATPRNSSAGASEPAPPLSFRLYLGWSLGTLGLTTFMVGGFLLLRFMTDYMAVPPAIAGTVFALAKIYDGIADPILGSLSDRTKSRWGRRRPYLLGGAFACALTFMLAFNAPIIENRAGAVAMLAALLILQATSYAIFAVPYMAMPAEMTDSPHERSKLMSFRVINGSLGNLMGGWATASIIAFFGGGLAGHRAMGIVTGLIIFAVLISCFWMTRTARQGQEAVADHPPFRKQLGGALKNRPFVVLQACKLMLLTAAAVHTASTAFFVQRTLQLSDAWLGSIFATLTVGTVAAQPFWLWLSRHRGKRATYIIAACFTAMSWLSWFGCGPGTSSWVIIAIGLAAGVGNGGIVMTSQSMLPDTIEYQYRSTGQRIEGSFAGIYIMVEKIGQAMGASLVGIILGLFGYVEARGGEEVQQPASAVLGITLSYSVISSLFLAFSAAIMFFYPLDERTMTLRGSGKD